MSVGDIKKRIKNADFVGISGFAQSGKDETAKILSIIGFQRVSLADPVRQGIYNINPIVVVYSNDSHYETLVYSSQFVGKHRVFNEYIILNLKEIVDFLGWDEAKKISEVRRLLQYYGTEGAREIFGQTIWTDTADKYIRENNITKVAVSDVRFLNELDWVRSKNNNLIIKIKREGIGPINNHSSDMGISDELCDIIIYNNGTLKDLEKEIYNKTNDI